MKTKSNHKTHSLYHFLADNSSEIIHHRIKTSTNPEHTAFYISLPCVDLKHKTWKLIEQHVTIERDINPKLDFLSPSHFTLCFEHKTNPSILCKIHVYFDASANFNGTILKEQIDLADEDIRILAQAGQQIIFELMQLKANKFIEIVQKIEQIDHELQTHMSDLTTLKFNIEKYNTVQQITQNYIQLLLKHDRYRDDDIRDNWDYLYHLSDALQLLEKPQPSRPSEQTEKATAVKAKAAVVTPLSKTPQSDALASTEKEAILVLVEKVKSAPTSKDITLLVQYANNLEVLNQALIIYDLTHDDEAFIAQIKSTLPKDIHDLASLFYELALSGDLETIQTLYENTTLKINFIDLFEKVLSAIEQQPQHCEHLIPIANYFYEHSELYRAYVLFRLKHTHIDTPIYLASIRTSTAVPSIKSNLLAQMFLRDHFSAFALYLRHGLSPLGCHAWCGRAGFNALQTLLLLLEYCPTNPEPYIKLLFEHGAVLHTPKIRLPETYYSMHLPHQSVSSTSDVFHKLSHPSKQSPLLFTPISSTQGMSTEQQTLIDELASQEHILPFAWRLKSDKTQSPLNMIMRHCDIDSCLIELHQILKQNYFLVSLIPSRQGGCFFYPSAQAYAQACRNREELKGGDDDQYIFAFDEQSIDGSLSAGTDVNKFMAGLFARSTPQSASVFTFHKTIAINIYPNPAYQSAKDIQSIQHHTSSAKIIYEAIKNLYPIAPSDIKSAIIQSMRKRAVEAQLKKDWLQASCYFQAGILAVSLHNPMNLNDYKLLFSMLFQYATCVDNIGSGSHLVLHDISVNASYLFSKLSRSIQTELVNLPAVQQILSIATPQNSKLPK